MTELTAMLEKQREIIEDQRAQIAAFERVLWMAARASGGRLVIPRPVKDEALGPIALVTTEQTVTGSLVLEARVAVDVIA